MMNPTSPAFNLGLNRTGVAMVPERAGELIESVLQGAPSSEGDEQLMADVRGDYVVLGEGIGHVPRPVTAEGTLKTGATPSMTVFIDKLGERLAFERSGTRLYEALLAKFDAVGDIPAGPKRGEIAHILNEELKHFALVKRSIEQLSGDPTAVTPSADVASVSSMGLAQVLTDPRTTFTQCLQAVLVAELVDNDGWAMLVVLSQKLGHDKLAEEFRSAFLSEQEHLERVRGWMLALTERAATS